MELKLHILSVARLLNRNKFYLISLYIYPAHCTHTSTESAVF